MDVVKDTLARPLGQIPHVVEGIEEDLARHEHLGGQVGVAGRAVGGLEGRAKEMRETFRIADLDALPGMMSTL